MSDREHTTEHMQYLKNKLQWLMFFRVVLASFFLGLAAITQLQQSDSYITRTLMSLYVLAGSICLLTFVYVFLLPRLKNLAMFAHAQIMVDLILITLLLFITGGINSIFSFLYSITIISASMCLYIYGGMLAATVASILYSALIYLQHVNLILTLQILPFVASGYSGEQLFFPITVNISAFYLVALLSSFLAEQAKKSRIQLREKLNDIETLEALNENIIKNIPSGLLTLDQEQRIITFNHAAQAITGFFHDQAYMHNIRDVFPGIEGVLCLEKPGSGIRSGTPRFELSFARKDDKIIHLGLSLSSLRDAGGREIGNILVFQDLTDYKAMQDYIKRMDRLAVVGRLAAGIAHEIRNPLASISGSIQVLRKSLKLNKADERLMDIIIRESNNLSMLISDFTQFARPDKQDKERLKLKPLIDEIVAIFKNSPECKHVFTIDQDIQDTIYITANQQQLKQVFWNLFINAAQAIASQGGIISLSARVREKGFQPLGYGHQAEAGGQKAPVLSWIEIQVADTGCGITEADLEAIFDPFYTTKVNGTGLGLSIVYKIIQEHDGTIAVESMKGKGTRFTIHLPY